MQEIEKLKRLVLQAQDLQEPFNYFFDLMDQKKIMNIKGHQVIKNLNENPELSTIIEILKSQISSHLGITPGEFIPLFHEIPEYHFIHGACTPKEQFLLITIIYFSDIKTGIFAVAGQTTHLFRFSLIKVTEGQSLH